MKAYMVLLILIIPILLLAENIPKNAHSNVYDTGCECDRRDYFRSREKCKKAIIPENSHITFYANCWECDPGYFRSNQKCEKVIVPENAHINVYGSDWECNKGYKKSNNKCIPMTKEDFRKQKELEQDILREIERRKF